MKEVFSIDGALTYQESNWKRRKNSVELTGTHALPFLTISREFGCLGYCVGEAIATILNKEYRHDPEWSVYDRAILDRLMKDMNISYKLAETLTDKAWTSMEYFFKTSFSKFPPEVMVYKKLVETIRILAANGHAIIIGRVGNAITADLSRGFHVRLYASPEKKIENIISQYRVTKNEARDILAKKGETREEFILKHLTVDLNDPSTYNMMINTTGLTIDETARLILKGMVHFNLIKQ